MDLFTKSYIETALWSSCDNNDNPLDESYFLSDISKESLQQIIIDCKAFQESYAKWLKPEHCRKHKSEDAILMQAGHDFWLTRNSHGTGFWDGDWSEEAGKALTEAAKSFGSVDLYVCDDEKIHSM
jgi:hypothetical protein